MTKPIHIGISDPKENQKTIVESAISMIEIHKHLEKIKKLRKEKIQTIKTLKTSFKELNSLIKKLDFPEIEEHPQHKITKHIIKPHKIIKHKKEPSTKLSKLEKDLYELKQRLKRIQ